MEEGYRVEYISGVGGLMRRFSLVQDLGIGDLIYLFMLELSYLDRQRFLKPFWRNSFRKPA